MGSTIVPLAAVLASGLMLWWRHLDSPTRPVGEVDPFAGVPAELRTAALVLTDVRHLMLMWLSLGLGSEKGWPSIAGGVDLIPSGAVFDVQMIGGQKLTDWTNDDTADQLAQYLGVAKVLVTRSDPGFVRVELRTFDTLAGAVEPGPVEPAVVEPVGVESTGVDLEAVHVGVHEDGRPWLLRILYAHILLAGATGSGKGSVLWSIVAGLGPAIKAGYVDIWVADPKGGMEFGRGEKLWVRFECDAPGILGMLAEAVSRMDERSARFRQAGIRKYVPSTEEPLVVIIIDEAAALSSYASREEQEKFRQLTGMLQSKGRAVGFSVISALQDPSKDTMPNRQLFPVRIGLRLDEPTQTAMVHGQGAKDRGALCHEIPDTTPGVGYVGEDGTTRLSRVRAFWVSDDHIDAIVAAYAPEHPDLSPQGDYTDFDPDFIPGEDDEPQGRAA
ncbi:FtsK/SpoIIIE domain-containing protein [Nocardia ignorata]|uniref:S-DNA-T family DNA segregation ATPase FtsK/SpoIIIE n=1 Tax=Nocardia ignorata TaxID=145285 RepID=A0A4R6P5D2_NOCIG|nr:FtsK/SpoIIIE domain-containing protein [Nocardia ignorata]TDP32333.1 S-DNA-T family DNA segregation ATPase FtsK/SpoIIIE [Nocardia ignorata]